MIKNRLTQWIRTQQFQPALLGSLVNPLYLARRALYLNIKELSSKCQGRLLDIGCGRKPYQSLFKCEQYVGLELDSERGRWSGAADYYYDGNELPFESASFDSVLCSQVLEHVFEPDKFISEIARVLVPDGTLLLTVPFIWGEHEQPNDFGRYSSFGLAALLARNGFTVSRHIKTLPNLAALFQSFNCYLYQLLTTERPAINLITCAVFHAPISVLGQVLGALLPGCSEIFVDNVVLARKETESRVDGSSPEPRESIVRC